MARKKKEECKGLPGWLISFGDLMSLLLTFFILLFSMGTISLEKFHMVIKGITESLGGRKIFLEEKVLNNTNLNIEFQNMYPKIKKRKRLEKALLELEKELEKKGIESEVEGHGSILRFRVNIDKMFFPGSEKPTPQAEEILKQICKKLKEAEYPLIIEGHTDNTPVSGRFKNNLELSMARALYILKKFIECGYDPSLLAARGYGPYRPLVPNNSPKNREKNRRVEFVIKITG
ncbi:MAG: flagellar motor protein MotB [Aquificae bacterium]|nr:flagellar motor protein MotB [Aquificota bacterium]